MVTIVQTVIRFPTLRMVATIVMEVKTIYVRGDYQLYLYPMIAETTMAHF